MGPNAGKEPRRPGEHEGLAKVWPSHVPAKYALGSATPIVQY